MVFTRTLLAAVGALALALPAAAQAGTLTRDGGTMTYRADAASGSAERVFVWNEGAQALVEADRGFSSFPPECSEVVDSENRLTCPPATAFVAFFLGFDDYLFTDGLTDATTIEAHGGAGNDSLDGAQNADGLYGDDGDDSLRGKIGNDTIEGGVGGDTLDGDQGDDTLRGGDGDDNLYGDEGNDTLEGGAGNEYGIEDGPGDDKVDAGPGGDSFVAGSGRDNFTGGDGADTVSYESRTAAVTVTLDGVADDGEAGEGDNVGADVESASGGSGNDRIVGQQAAGTQGGYLYGFGGDDNIKGGPGGDRIEGGDGNDIIDSRDGRDDSIDCGGGTDTVFGDPADSTTNCEFAPDADGDGHLVPADCAPNDPLVHPGAGEVFGNPIDENCDGVVGYLRVVAPITYSVAKKTRPRETRFRVFRITELQVNDRVEIRCRGKRCPFKLKVFTVRAGQTTINVASLLKKRFFKPGVVVEIRILRANQIGIANKYRIGRNGSVTVQRLCMPVGATAPAACT